MARNQIQPKLIFTLNGERYVSDESGQLIPLVNEVKENPWKVVNTIVDICKILGISRSTLMRLIESGKLWVYNVLPIING
jgi:hypothetical protein